MLNFKYQNPTKIIFGKDTHKEVGKLINPKAAKVLLLYGGGSIKQNGVYDEVVSSLNEGQVEFIELGGVKPNPRLSLVEEGIALCRENGVNFILAVGGGSVIDSAKCIAVGVVAEGDIWSYFSDSGNKTVAKALPLGVIPTIHASGSESSNSAVLTNEATGLKRGIFSQAIIPKFAILNPELTFSMPSAQIANGVSDIISHLFERYFTQVKNVDFTDRLLEASMTTILINGPLAVKDPRNYDIRAELMWAGCVAHNNLLSTGRTGDWACHEISHELAGMFDINHGASMAIITPAWMRYVYEENIDKFVQLAQRVFHVGFSLENKEALVLEMIKRLEDWYVEMGLPISLSAFDIPEDKYREMADKCLYGREFVGNFKHLNADDVYNILELAT